MTHTVHIIMKTPPFLWGFFVSLLWAFLRVGATGLKQDTF